MSYGRTMRLAAAGSLLALISYAVHADVLIDTGLPTSDLFSTLCTWRAGQITSTSSLTISGVENYVQVSQPIVARITLRADEGGLPGAILYSTNHSLTVASEGFQGPLNLSWTVGPGSYWFTFEVPYNPELLDCPTSAARRRLGFTTNDPRPELHGTAPPNALAREAYLPIGGSLWETNSTRLGWRVTGTQGGFVINGREWRQLAETVNLSWDQVASVCNPTTGSCSGSVGGVSFDGWTWAASSDVLALFEELIEPGTTNFPAGTLTFQQANSPAIDAAIGTSAFLPTLVQDPPNAVELVMGWTRSQSTLSGSTISYTPELLNVIDPSVLDRASVQWTGWYPDDILSLGGVWLYREVYAGSLSLSLSTPTAPGCRTVTGTLTLSEPASVGGALVTLSDTLAQASMPATVVIPEGETTATFLITTTPVSSSRTGSVSASLGGQTVSQPLTLRAIGLASLRLDPLSVVGSKPVQGQAQLECPAGPGPIVVNLESSEPALANPVSPYLVIPQGVQSEQFTVTTNLVPADTTVQIVGTANDTRRSRGLNIEQPLAVTPTRASLGKVVLHEFAEAEFTVTNRSAVALQLTFGWRNLPENTANQGGILECYYGWIAAGGSCRTRFGFYAKSVGKISWNVYWNSMAPYTEPVWAVIKATVVAPN